MYQHIPSADTKVNLTEDDFSRASGQTGQQEENNTGTQETQRQKGSKPEIRSGNGGAPRDRQRGTDREISRVRRGGGRTLHYGAGSGRGATGSRLRGEAKDRKTPGTAWYISFGC